jgi:hypothetical protein
MTADVAAAQPAPADEIRATTDANINGWQLFFQEALVEVAARLQSSPIVSHASTSGGTGDARDEGGDAEHGSATEHSSGTNRSSTQTGGRDRDDTLGTSLALSVQVPRGGARGIRLALADGACVNIPLPERLDAGKIIDFVIEGQQLETWPRSDILALKQGRFDVLRWQPPPNGPTSSLSPPTRLLRAFLTSLEKRRSPHHSPGAERLGAGQQS